MPDSEDDASGSSKDRSSHSQFGDLEVVAQPGESHRPRQTEESREPLRNPAIEHIRIGEAEVRRHSAQSSIHLGSYRRSPYQSRLSLDHPEIPQSRTSSHRKQSIGHLKLQHLLDELDVDQETYGLEEVRDGFFDTAFFRPKKRPATGSGPDSSKTFEKINKHSISLIRSSFLDSWQQILNAIVRLTTTRAGIKLLKSFLCYFIAYVICLIPSCRDWLGRYNYMLVLSVLLNHPGRTVGSQLDGALLTISGTAVGLGWGALALYVSTSTGPARNGYGGILAVFLVLFTFLISWLRSVHIRFYQAVIAAGIAICYVCLANTAATVSWSKLLDHAIPWILGQALAFTIASTMAPDAGSRPLAVALHGALEVLQRAVSAIRNCEDHALYSRELKQNLAWHFVNMSQAVRDFTIDISVSKFSPEDSRSLRNAIQGCIRACLSLHPNNSLFKLKGNQDHVVAIKKSDSETSLEPNSEPSLRLAEAVERIRNSLADPVRTLLQAMEDGLKVIDAALMDISGYRYWLGPPKTIAPNVSERLAVLQAAMRTFDAEDQSLQESSSLYPSYHDHPEIVEMFLFLHPVRQAADRLAALLALVVKIQEKNRGWRIQLPTYPLAKGLNRTNAQVRHDRGGLTAGFYFRTKAQLEKMMKDLQSTEYTPWSRRASMSDVQKRSTQPTLGEYEDEKEVAMDKGSSAAETTRIRYRIWLLLHRLQGFEARFALKFVLTTSLLSIPAWLPASNGWWDEYNSWWSVVAVWLMMHPRVGGNLQDLFARVCCTILGSLWGGLAYAAGNGNPYVMAFFMLVLMIPMMYRFTQSSHPRSGLMGCLSFSVVSLELYTLQGSPHSTANIAWTRGIVFTVGVVAAVVVNWVLWPFVARHELRKSLSTMMLHLAILYRGVVAKYIYFQSGHEPTKADIERSEMLEGRLREGFVRIRQLMDLTHHEIRLRGPFQPAPYVELIDDLANFFERLVELRQSSLYFQPYMLYTGTELIEALITVRRDAVAAILMTLYILAGALRSNRPVPRYLPSAAVARKRLLDRMEAVELEQRKGKGNGIAQTMGRRGGLRRRWADVYQFAYNVALTGVVEQLDRLREHTIRVTGEMEFALDD